MREFFNMPFHFCIEYATNCARKTILALFSTVFVGIGPASGQINLNRPINLIATAPPGSWVNLSTNSISDVWTPWPLRPNDDWTPSSVIDSWGGMAWDSTRKKLFVKGGGHANYPGNEVYSWDATSGLWSRASLPSTLVPVNHPSAPLSQMPIDGAVKGAPNSCHEYSSPAYLPVADRIVFFCGGGFNGGLTNIFQRTDGSAFYPGPFFFDPAKADPWKVGGTQGSHVKRDPLYSDPNSIAAGNMWQGREVWGALPIGDGPAFLNSTSAYRKENGQDVLYVAASNGNGSSALFLHRYVVPSQANPGADSWTRVGAYWNGYADGQGAGVIHPELNLFIRSTGSGSQFMSWSLDPAKMANLSSNQDTLIAPVVAAGHTFSNVHNAALSWDTNRNRIRVWQGGSEVWELYPTTATNGSVTWHLDPISAPGQTGPSEIPYRGVHNRFQFIPELDVYLSVVEGQNGTVWAYKPADWSNPTPSQLPSVSITSPVGGTSYTAPASFAIVANSSTPVGSITKVDFFVNNVAAGTATTAPWQAQWNNIPPGQYQITAKAINTTGGTTTSAPVTINVVPANLPPIADIKVVPGLSGTTSTSFSFSGVSSSDADGTISNYLWEFGDGQTASGVSATHQYTSAASYTARLTVTDNNGASTSSTKTITVTQPIVNQPPSSIFTVSPGLSAPVGSQFNLSGIASSDPDGTITSYIWDFGDGTTASTVNTTKVYSAAGTYLVRLTVIDNSNASVSSTQTITVTPVTANQPPIARITFSPNAVGTTATIFNFSASTSTDSDGSISQYMWQFGDGTTSASVSPSKQYSLAGSYTVQLTVTDNSGAVNTTDLLISVATPQAVSLSFTKTVNVNTASGMISSVSALGQTLPVISNGAGSYSFVVASPLPANVVVTIVTTGVGGATNSQNVTIAVP
jgi:PKD repeat protein